MGLVAVAATVGGDTAQAQVRWGVAIGNGGVRVGVGNGGYGYRPGYYGRGYGPGYYGPGNYGPGYYGPGYGYGYGYAPPVVIAPQPVIVPQPAYVQPQPSYVQPQPNYGLLDQPQPYSPGVTSGPSVIPPSPSLAESSSADGGEILLFSPPTNPSDIRYNLNGRSYTMRPGTKQKFTNDRNWKIQFESSPGQVATYTLNSTRYKFKATEGATALYETQDLPEETRSTLPPAPVPEPPEPGTVIPSRPPLKTAP